MILSMPGELGVLLPFARLNPSASVMNSTCLGPASHSENGQQIIVCPFRTIRFNNVVSLKTPSFPPNTP